MVLRSRCPVAVIALVAAAARALAAPSAEVLSLSLGEALDRAQDHAYGVEVARTGVYEARGLERMARARSRPSLSLSEELVRTDDAVGAFGTRLRQERFREADFAVDALNRPQPITDLRTVLEAHQPLFSSGRGRAEQRAARAGTAAAVAELDRVRDRIRLQTAEAYWALALSAASVEATEAALRAARRHAAEAAAMVRAGALPRADSLAADLRVAQLQTQRIETHRQQRDASDALTLVLGMRVGSLVRAVDPLEPAPLTEPDSDGVRADLEALRQRRQAAVHQADAEDAALLPQLSAFARVTLDGDAPSLADGESWTAGAVLRWELFAGGALRGRAQAARARALRLRHQERELTARIERQRLQSHREVTAAAQRIEAADAAEAVATERLRVTQLTYGAGAARTSDLLAAEADAHTARLLRLKAVHDLRVAKARVEFAHGGRPAPTQDRRRREP